MKTPTQDSMETRAKLAEIASRLTWLTIEQAAAYMNLSGSRIRNMIREGRLPASKDAHTVRIKRENLDQFWQQRQLLAPEAGFAAPVPQSASETGDSRTVA